MNSDIRAITELQERMQILEDTVLKQQKELTDILHNIAADVEKTIVKWDAHDTTIAGRVQTLEKVVDAFNTNTVLCTSIQE